MHVWEASCAACGGLGCSRPRAAWAGGGRGRGRGRGRGTPHAAYTTCAVCAGIGYVRHTSARVWPDMRGAQGGVSAAGSSSEGSGTSGSSSPCAARPNTTLGRPPRVDSSDDSDSEWETDSEDEGGGSE